LAARITLYVLTCAHLTAFFGRRIKRSSNVIGALECPRIVSLISDEIAIDILTANALVGPQIIARFSRFDAPYRDVLTAFCTRRRVPFCRRQPRAMAPPMLPQLMSRPLVVFHAHAHRNRRGLSTSAASYSFRRADLVDLAALVSRTDDLSRLVSLHLTIGDRRGCTIYLAVRRQTISLVERLSRVQTVDLI
jgi:hypothetical protein